MGVSGGGRAGLMGGWGVHVMEFLGEVVRGVGREGGRGVVEGREGGRVARSAAGCVEGWWEEGRRVGLGAPARDAKGAAACMRSHNLPYVC